MFFVLTYCVSSRMSVFRELWGPKFQKMIRGIAFSDDIQTMITMWEVKAQMYGTPPLDAVETEDKA